MSIFWKNGEFVSKAQASSGPTLFSLNYAVCGFEGIRAYQTQSGRHLFRLDEHINRFLSTCAYLGITSTHLNAGGLSDAIFSIVANADHGDLYIRPIAYFDEGIMNLRSTPPSVVAIFAQPFEAKSEAEISVQTSSHVRDIGTITRKISRNYFDSYMALQNKSDDFDEVLMLSENGMLTETSAHNVFLQLSGGEVITPSLDYCLPGITRDCVIKLMAECDIIVSERAINQKELRLVSSAAICSTASEIKIVKNIDGHELDTKETPFEFARKLLRQNIHGSGSYSKEWNSYV